MPHTHREAGVEFFGAEGAVALARCHKLILPEEARRERVCVS